MEKKFSRLRIVDVLVILGILVGTLSAAGYLNIFDYFFRFGKTEKKQKEAVASLPDLERLEGKIWNSELIYIDRQGQYTLIFVDPDKDGQVDRVGSSARNYDKENKVSETPVMTFYIAETYSSAEATNSRIFREQILNGQFCLARDSSEAQELQELYDSARAEYRKRHPKLKLPENADLSTRVRPQMITRFKLLLAEYRRQDTIVQKAKTQRRSELAAYRAYLAFLEINGMYRLLNEWEKRYLFKTVENLPQGFKIDSGPDIIQILGIALVDTRDVRGNFESFLKLSYEETDYMSAWSISGETEKIKKQYYDDLKSRGLKVTSDE